MGTHPIFESDFDCLTENMDIIREIAILPFPKPDNYHGALSKWVKVPSQQLVKNVLLFGYFLLIGGFVYDIQNQPSGMGQYVDPITGLMRPMTFLQGRINGQFIIEGFAASVVIAVGTFGFIIIDHANKPGIQRRSSIVHDVEWIHFNYWFCYFTQYFHFFENGKLFLILSCLKIEKLIL